MLGRVIQFNPDNGLGLIEREGDKKQWLFSYSQFRKVDERELKLGALVQFELAFGTDKISELYYPQAAGRKAERFFLT